MSSCSDMRLRLKPLDVQLARMRGKPRLRGSHSKPAGIENPEQYQVQCRWSLRAAWMAQVTLRRFRPQAPDSYFIVPSGFTASVAFVKKNARDPATRNELYIRA